MTAQISDVLVNLHPRVKTDGLRLFGVIRGDPRSSSGGWGEGSAFTTLPTFPENSSRHTALMRGYVATFELAPEGHLKLTAFSYMIGFDEWQDQEIDERLEGDFWLVLKPGFHGTRTYIPFHDGLVIEDPARWFIEKPWEIRIDRREPPADD